MKALLGHKVQAVEYSSDLRHGIRDAKNTFSLLNIAHQISQVRTPYQETQTALLKQKKLKKYRPKGR
jgi:hypothetical protein